MEFAGLLQAQAGFELYIHSGARCITCNIKIGGAPHSAHLPDSHEDKRACALDIGFKNSHEKFLIGKYAYELGIKRIEFRDTWIHIDMGKETAGYGQEVSF